MGKTTVQILPTTSYGTATGNYLGAAADFVSDNVKGDGYYGFADGVHTAQVRVTAFVGTVKLQASLEKTPTSTDWVDISGAVITAGVATTSSTFWNFTGNYVWIRASVSSFTAGTINTLMMAN
jgi:hypothetical protein